MLKPRLIDRTVAKHSALIQITGAAGLLGRKMWNVMLAKAYPNLLEEDFHTIGYEELCQTAMGVERSGDVELVKKNLADLVGTKVEFNLLGKAGGGKNVWGVSSVLASAKMENGVIRYEFSRLMKQLLYKPEMYARVSLSLQTKFRSKYGLILYELVLDYFDAKRQRGETPWIDMVALRELFGMGDGEYPKFSEFNRRVIKTSIAEVNEFSGIEVQCFFARDDKRFITAAKFAAKAKKGFLPQKVSSLPCPKSKSELSGCETPVEPMGISWGF